MQGGGTESITAKNVIIATGSDVLDLPGIKVCLFVFICVIVGLTCVV